MSEGTKGSDCAGAMPGRAVVGGGGTCVVADCARYHAVMLNAVTGHRAKEPSVSRLRSQKAEARPVSGLSREKSTEVNGHSNLHSSVCGRGDARGVVRGARGGERGDGRGGYAGPSDASWRLPYFEALSQTWHVSSDVMEKGMYSSARPIRSATRSMSEPQSMYGRPAA